MDLGDDSNKSKFLARLKNYDGRLILWNKDNFYSLIRKDLLLPSKEDDFESQYAARLEKHKDELLHGIDFDGVRHYNFTEFNYLFSREKADVLGKTCAGTMYKFFDGTKSYIVKTWEVTIPFKDYSEKHPSRLYNEIMLLTNKAISHPFFPKLVGYTMDRRLAVIYDVNPRGNIRVLLNAGDFKNWTARMDIAIQIARFLHHLHNVTKMAIGTIDPINICVDEGDNIKLCAFAPFAFEPKMANALCQPVVECLGTSSIKDDILSYGILLAELMSSNGFKDTNEALGVIVQKAKEGSFVDVSLLDDVDKGRRISELIRRCVNSNQDKRPDAGTVLAELEDIVRGGKVRKDTKDMEQQPTSPKKPKLNH